MSAHVDAFLTLVPPWLAFVVAGGVAAVATRRLGTAVGVGLTALVVPWLWLAPAGDHVVVAVLGFEQVLFRVDGFTRLVGMVFAFVASANVLYGHATGADGRQTALSLAYMGSGVAAVLAGDWLTLVLAWELLAVTATVLVWYHGGDAVRPAFRYAVYHLIGGVLLVAGVITHYAAAGTFAYAAGFTAGLPTALAVLGVGINLGFVGLHYWLPDTYPRPHVAASVVLAAFTTKVAVYTLARLVPDGNVFVAWMGGAMVVYGVTLAILQTDTRRLLSYHIMSQVGYMTAAIGIGTAAGTAGAFAHLSTHVLYKGLLFMVAGALIVRIGESSLKRMGGLGRAMPLTFLAFLAAAFAISGVPGFSGFVSKGLVTKAVEKGGGELLWWLLVAGSVGTVLSFAKFGYYAFVRAAPAPLTVRDGSPALSVSLVAVAIPCVVLGLAPGLLFDVLPADTGGFTPYGTSELTKGVVLTLVGVGGFIALRGPLSGLRSVDVNVVLHPAALRLARGASRLTIQTGVRATALAAEPAHRVAAQLTPGANRPVESGIGTATGLIFVILTAIMLFVAIF